MTDAVLAVVALVLLVFAGALWPPRRATTWRRWTRPLRRRLRPRRYGYRH